MLFSVVGDSMHTGRSITNPFFHTRPMMIRFLFSVLLSLCLLPLLPAQTEKNDPKAKTILDKVRKKYEGYKNMEAAFVLTIEVPGMAKEVQKGTVSQEGDMFRLEMDQQTIISDTKSTWVWLKKNNEVQINNAAPEDSGESAFITPRTLLRRYEKGDFVYAITDKSTENGQSLTYIEFKPKDKKSDFSKLRVAIDEKANTMQSIKAFGKDGSRYTFVLARFTPNKTFAKGHFQFDPKKHPGVKVEDLRI
jgi:outer membrane lipoprotein carrier protein